MKRNEEVEERNVLSDPEVMESFAHDLDEACKDLNYLSVAIQRLERRLGTLSDFLRGRK